MSELTWGLFVALAASAILIALGLPFGPVLLFGLIIVFAIAFRYPYFTFYTAIALIPFLGLTLSVPTGELAFGKRAFGGSIDISVAEGILLVLLIAWAFKIIWLWLRRRDRNWKPILPIVWSYASLVAAHLVSALSPLAPDRILVMKFALRPVLFCYLAYVALPVNFIRSRRRLVGALSVLTTVGVFAALNGLLSLFFVDASSQFIHRAHPLPLFGVPVLGDNHNLLAEILVVSVMATLALIELVKTPRAKRILTAAAAFQFLIGLLTFSRTAWIVFAVQAAFIAVMAYRDVVRRHLSKALTVIVLLIPLGLVMASIATSTVATSSDSTRIALLEISEQVFFSSPWIGGGAGTFIDRVGSAYVFRIEYGQPFDSHGIIQKLAAETGIFGLAAFLFICLTLVREAYETFRRLGPGAFRRAAIFLTAGALGAILYQLFNTNYWTGKMWLPIGLMLAAFRVFREHKEEKELL
ncbi:MAG: O-antigen ligase family protein [Patescibacteria group bacterium]